MTTTKQIIECAVLQNKLEQIDDEGDELERTHREWKTAFAQLEPADYSALFMARKLLEGESHRVTKPHRVSPDEAEPIRRCIAVANALGATVEPGGDPFLGPLPSDMRTITFYPAQQPVQ